jgi:predicted regulator of amino acid metabolism with ACT domain
VDDRPGVLAHVAERLAAHEVSIARLVQEQLDGAAALHIVTHEARSGGVTAALEDIGRLPETWTTPSALTVISDRGVPGLGWA